MPQYVSYRSPKTVISESVFQFMHGLIYGTAWGLVTPFPPPFAKSAATVKTPFVPPFAHPVAAVTTHAIGFACILGVQRLGAKSCELMHARQDVLNNFVGLAVVVPYYRTFLNHSEKRLVRHNRVVGATVLAAVAYANLLA